MKYTTIDITTKCPACNTELDHCAKPGMHTGPKPGDKGLCQCGAVLMFDENLKLVPDPNPDIGAAFNTAIFAQYLKEKGEIQ